MAATISIQPTAARTDGCSAVCPNYYSGTGSYSSSPSAGKFAFTNYQFTATATTGWRVKRVIFHTSWNASDGSSGTRTYTFRNSDNVNPYVIPEAQKYTQEWPYDFRETDPGDEWRLRTTLETITDIEVLFEVGPTPPPSVKVISAYASPSDGGTVQVGSDDSGTSSSYAVEIGGSVNIVATPASGYVFKGWYLGNTLISSSATYTVSNVRAAQTFEARFVPVYTIRVVTFSSKGTVSLTDGTDDSSDPAFNVKTCVVESGTQVTIGAYSNNASIWPFKAWYRDPYAWGDPEHSGTLVSGAGATYTFIASASATYFATFEDGGSVWVSTTPSPAQPEAKVSINGQTNNTYEYDLAVPTGSTVTVSASERGGPQPFPYLIMYYFEGWINSDTDSPEYGTMLSTDMVYTFQLEVKQGYSGPYSYANLKAQYAEFEQIETEVMPDVAMGSISASQPPKDGEWFRMNSTVTFTATPSPYYRFVKWTRVYESTEREYDYSTNNQITLTVGTGSRGVFRAYFEWDGTDLLVNSSNLGSPVKLVYDDRPGGTGLLVADY